MHKWWHLSSDQWYRRMSMSIAYQLDQCQIRYYDIFIFIHLLTSDATNFCNLLPSSIDEILQLNFDNHCIPCDKNSSPKIYRQCLIEQDASQAFVDMIDTSRTEFCSGNNNGICSIIIEKGCLAMLLFDNEL